MSADHFALHRRACLARAVIVWWDAARGSFAVSGDSLTRFFDLTELEAMTQFIAVQTSHQGAPTEAYIEKQRQELIVRKTVRPSRPSFPPSHIPTIEELI